MRSPTLLLFLLALLAVPASLNGSVALFVEEPYGEFGHMNPTGHAAVYLSGVCAESPTLLRSCLPGETGVVISRYHKIAGYDWIAIPLIPYLYAVEDADDAPAAGDLHMIAELRERYWRDHLQSILPGGTSSEVPKEELEQLLGAAFIRRIYAFEVESNAEQDQNLIRALNERPNRSHFNLLFHNCTDFSRYVMNFYYPGALHRNLIADVGISTPKQMAKTLVGYSRKHSRLELSKFIIPQVPGTIPRSEAVHGVLESIVRSKKYALPLLALHPFIGSSVAVAYVARGRFDPARNAAMLDTPAAAEQTLADTFHHASPNAPKRSGAEESIASASLDPCSSSSQFGNHVPIVPFCSMTIPSARRLTMI